MENALTGLLPQQTQRLFEGRGCDFLTSPGHRRPALEVALGRCLVADVAQRANRTAGRTAAQNSVLRVRGISEQVNSLCSLENASSFPSWNEPHQSAAGEAGNGMFQQVLPPLGGERVSSKQEWKQYVA